MSSYQKLAWVLRKARAALDRPLSRFEIANLPIEVEGQASYRERAIIREFAWILADGCSTVYDIGASTGLYANAFGRVASVDRIVAFEPLHDVFVQLERNVGTQPKISCLNVALGDQNAERQMFRNDFSPSSSLLEMAESHVRLFPHTGNVTTERVDMKMLDEVVVEFDLPQPDLIKLDVQGYELRVLEGATRVLRAAKYIVTEVNLIELYDGMARFDELYSLLRNAGFDFRGVIDSLNAGEANAPVAVDAVFVNRQQVSEDRLSSDGRR